jgi:hypothetical protein
LRIDPPTKQNGAEARAQESASGSMKGIDRIRCASDQASALLKVPHFFSRFRIFLAYRNCGNNVMMLSAD